MASLLKGLQISSVITNFVVALLGLAVMAVGVTTLDNETKYFTITDGRTELHRIPYSLILVGICVVCLALIGIVGALTTRAIGGRILLGVYTFVLSLIIFSEIAAGGSALRARTTFKETFVDSSLEFLKNSYSNSNKSQLWDNFQQKHKCCGAENYTSYIKYNHSVPESCCVQPNSKECEDARHDDTNTTLGQYFYSKGCPEAVLGILQSYYLVIAIVMMVFGLAQCSGVILGCFLAAVSSRKDSLKKHVSPPHYKPLSTVQT